MNESPLVMYIAIIYLLKYRAFVLDLRISGGTKKKRKSYREKRKYQVVIGAHWAEAARSIVGCICGWVSPAVVEFDLPRIRYISLIVDRRYRFVDGWYM
jgi:hypothetical protein